MADANVSIEDQGMRRMPPLRSLADRTVKAIKAPVVTLVIATYEGIHSIKGYFVSQGSKAARTLRQFLGSPRTTDSEMVQPDLVCPFHKDDVYISVGMDWEHKDWTYFEKLRASLDLKSLLCCYDLIPIKTPGLTTQHVAERFPGYILSLARSADKIMCISRTTKSDLDSFLVQSGQPATHSEVFYLGTDLPSHSVDQSPSSAAKEVIDHGRFIMLVSTIERRKGHDTLYRAYQRLIDQEHSELPLLVFVGMPGWGVDDLLADIKITKRVAKHIRFLSHVSDGDLSLLYRHCLFTVFPSVYEGWGLPVSESLTHGKFCLASNAASIPEAGGEFCEYLDPWNVALWVERLAFYFTHQDVLTVRESHILKHYKPHTWLDAASNIVSAAETMQTS